MKMMRMIMTLVLALSGLVNVGLGQPVDESAAFKGTGAGQITGAQPGPTGLALSGSATGKATLLGRYTRVENILVGPDGSFTGEVTFTAANGDQLTAGIAGAFTSATTAAGTY